MYALLTLAQVHIPALEKLSEKALMFAGFQGALLAGLVVLTVIYALERKAK